MKHCFLPLFFLTISMNNYTSQKPEIDKNTLFYCIVSHLYKTPQAVLLYDNQIWQHTIVHEKVDQISKFLLKKYLDAEESAKGWGGSNGITIIDNHAPNNYHDDW